MREVVNISLQGVSFTVESNALELLEQYLDELRQYYGEGEAEVVNDIEERIAELLIERGCKDSTVRYHHVDEIINILGHPNQMEGEENPKKGKKVKRRIFRDTQNGIVAGVCSGLGAYWNMDAVWVRILFFLVSFVITVPVFSIGKTILRIDMGWAGFMLVAYCVMWIIIPPARTVAQRCQMRGEAQNVDNIHRKFAQGARDAGSEMWQAGTKVTGTFFSTLWRVICFCVGVLLTAFGFGGIVALGVCLLGLDIVHGISLLSVPDFIELNIGSTMWLKVFGVLAFLLPCVGMLHGGLKLCFRFNSPKWRPGLVLFLAWLASSFIFVVCSVKALNPYYDLNTDYKEEMAFSSPKDTVYVECPQVLGMERVKLNIEVAGYSLEMFYLNNDEGRGTELAWYPKLIIRRSADISVPYIRGTFTSLYWGETKLGEVASVQDSLLTLIPQVYSKEKKFAGKLHTIWLYVPDSTEVVLKEPVELTFGERSYRCGIFK